MMLRTEKQVLRSRAFRALAQDDMPHLATEEKGRSMDPECHPSFSSSHEASKHVILSAEGAKDLLVGGARGMVNG